MILLKLLFRCKHRGIKPQEIKSGVSRYIKRFRNQILSKEDVNRILKAIEKHSSEYSFSNRDHIRSLRQRHSSITICPRCGSNLIERTAKQGSNAGTKFLGCDNYPKCRFIKNT